MIRQIETLRRVVKRWKTLNHRAKSKHISCSDEDPSHPVRPGFIAINVGLDTNYLRRFVIPLRFINFPVFLALLKNTEEAIGIHRTGALVVVCEVEFFRTVLELLENDEERFKAMEIEGFQDFFDRYGGVEFDSSSSCKDECTSRHCNSFSASPREN